MADPALVPTVDEIYRAKRDMNDINTFTVSKDLTFPDSEGRERLTLDGVIKNASQKTGWFNVGTFAAGFQFTSFNQVGRDNDGIDWSYNGLPETLPYTVAPGTIPSEPLFTNRGDASRWTELSNINSSTPIAGQPASAIAQSIKDKITISELVRGFGAAAWTQAVNYKTLVINESVVKSGQYIIPDGQTIIFENNPAVVQSDDLTAFIAPNSNWHILGAGYILQSGLTLPTSYVAASRGILVSPTAFDWSITGNIRIMWFKGAGFEADGGGILTDRTGYNQISGMHCDKNWDNVRVLDGFPAEYLTVSNLRSTWAANYGALIEAGNITWNGGDIVYNKGGVKLRHPTAGGNPHHGMFTGVNINHNIDYQLHAEITAAGYDFVGCHFYDNDNPNPLIGGILLDRCRGINITGGTIGCNIVPTTKGGFVGHVGYNRIAGNKIDRNRAIITGTGYDRSKLFVEDNFDNNGSWLFNDQARVFAQRRISGSPQVLSGSSSYGLIELGTKLFDNRNKLNASFVAPFYGVYGVSLQSTITSSIAFSTEYISFARDDTATGSFEELYRVTLADIAGPTNLKAALDFLYEFVVSTGGQIQIYLFGANPAATYSFSVGTLITVKSYR